MHQIRRLAFVALTVAVLPCCQGCGQQALDAKASDQKADLQDDDASPVAMDREVPVDVTLVGGTQPLDDGAAAGEPGRLSPPEGIADDGAVGAPLLVSPHDGSVEFYDQPPLEVVVPLEPVYEPLPRQRSQGTGGVVIGHDQGFRVDGGKGARVQFGGGQGFRINGARGRGVQFGGGRGVVIGEVGTE